MNVIGRGRARSDIRTRRVHSDYGCDILPAAARSERETSRDDIPRLADRLERRMSWSQLGLAALSVIGLITGLNGLAEAVGLASEDAIVRSGPLALAIYVLSGWGLAWALARGDHAVAMRRFALILTGGILLIALAAAAGQLLSSTSGGGSGGSDGSGSSSRRARPAKTGLAAAVCDLDLAQAALGGGALDGPHSHDNPVMRRVSMCSCSGPAGTVTLTVAPSDRAGRWADPTAAFPLALAGDARWVVRTTARPADGHEVDQAALQQLADRALASLPG